MNTIRVTVWGENVHDTRENETGEKTRACYPDGMHTFIAAFLNKLPGIEAKTATLQQDENGLTDEVLDDTDVLTWWGHAAHDDVEEAIVDRVQQRVLAGMGLIALHSSQDSKIFKRLMGTNCSLRWREIGEKTRLWNVAPGHMITRGLPDHFELPRAEMYGEHFDIPEPDKLVLISWFQGGEVFRSGCCWDRGNGRVFYFQPGHETLPIYHDPNIQKVIGNAVRWANTGVNRSTNIIRNVDALEDI